MAATLTDAERRLRQMYHHCEIVTVAQPVPRRGHARYQGVIGLKRQCPVTQRPAPINSSYRSA
jgi:hypothetical protein